MRMKAPTPMCMFPPMNLLIVTVYCYLKMEIFSQIIIKTKLNSISIVGSLSPLILIQLEP